jgi:glyoxylase-like metal-dependent hydrolase (beta-lactamase superfamily II)
MPNSQIAQIPGVYHRKIGEIIVTAVSDGYLDGDVSVLRNIDENDAMAMLKANFRKGRRTFVNGFIIRSKGRTALVETGSGNYLLPTAGKLLSNVIAAGVDPKEIDTVLLTHMHPDHSAGLTNMADNSLYFPNAELVAHENEPKHWQDDSAMARADDRAKKLYFQAAREQITPYAKQSRFFQKDEEVFPGVTALRAHGHTPGHTCYMIESGGESLLIWGDIVHVPEIQTARPEVAIAFDTDIEAAIASRRRIFDMAEQDGLLVAGMHLHFPTFSHLVKSGEGYSLIPEPWAHDM